MNSALLRNFARWVYFSLSLSVYIVSVGGFYLLVTQTENVSLWGLMLCIAPVIVLLLLLMSVALQWMRQVAQQDVQSRMHDFCQWYCRACEELRLLRALRAMCLWLVRIHILSAALILCVIPLYCLFDEALSCMHICMAVSAYVLVMLCCAVMNRRALGV